MLAWTKERTGGWVRVAFYGHLTEEANLVVLGRELAASQVILDLGGIRWVNSWGVSKWVDFVAALRAQGTLIVFERCSVPVVRQLNIVPAFRGAAAVRSAFAPYYCRGCNVEKLRLIHMDRDVEPQVAPPEACDRCRGSMDFDELVEHYERLQPA